MDGKHIAICLVKELCPFPYDLILCGLNITQVSISEPRTTNTEIFHLLCFIIHLQTPNSIYLKKQPPLCILRLQQNILKITELTNISSISALYRHDTPVPLIVFERSKLVCFFSTTIAYLTLVAKSRMFLTIIHMVYHIQVGMFLTVIHMVYHI